MVVKTSKRISKYMGNIDIIFINGEKDPSCVSDVENIKDNVNTNGGQTGQRRENLSSGGIAIVAVGAMLFLMIFIIMAAVFVRRRLPRRPNQAEKYSLSCSFNNPGYDHNVDNPDASPFTIPEYEEIPAIIKRQRTSTHRQEGDPVYAEIGPSLTAKKNEIMIMNKTVKDRIAAQLDACLVRKWQWSALILFTNRSSWNLSPKRNTRGKTNSSLNNNRLDKGTRENISACGPKGTTSTCPSGKKSSDSCYPSLAKRELRRDANRTGELHYSKTPRGLPVPAARSNVPLGVTATKPSHGSEFESTGYAQLDPSTLVHSGNRKDPCKSRTTQDQLPHMNNGCPNLERHRAKSNTPVDTVEDNGSYSWNMENKAVKTSRPRSHRTSNSGQVGYPEGQITDENNTQHKNNQGIWDANSRVEEALILNFTNEICPEETII
ncbi:hypothetical protein OS493_028964 [Desmophyllum pertusum]|uniref:Uncharacterized protein n=1 Tax=Desmophyllum pertusum TaxID=174260 RepID=A0A9W9YWN5_9CNID|nr:hypothetical protein OS493_028964 [Desmophyllum pertusum]